MDINNKNYIKYKDFFYNSIIPVIGEFEKKRIKCLFKIIFFSLIFILLGAGTAYFFFYLFLHSIYNPILWTVLLLIIYALLFRGLFYYVEIAREFENEYTQFILNYFFKPVANFKPWPRNHNKESIIDSDIFPNFVIQEDAESYFGYYNRTNVMITDTSLATVTPMNKHDLFRGTIVQLELEKNISNHVIIQPKSMPNPRGYAKIAGYENIFEIFSSDKNDSVDFIDDEFLMIVKKLVAAYHAYSFRMSLKNNIILIALPSNEKLFGLKCMFKSLKNIKTYDELIEKFIAVFNIVDKLNSI